MDKVIDFTNCKRIFRALGGTDQKFEVEYEGKAYILKFSGKHSKRTDMSTSYVNNIVSEYICSHISASMGLPTHDTVLGLYEDRPVVGCVDFRSPGDENMEFKEFVRSNYDDEEIKRTIRLDQIYHTLHDPRSFTPKLRRASIDRYWDTFVADALVGNFDRHIGNWGYLSKSNNLSIAPVYDFGSSILPQLSDEGMLKIIDDDFQMFKRCLVFPSASLFISIEKTGKVGYYDMLSSDYDIECTSAVNRMVPKIQKDLIHQIIDETPMISNVRKDFYKKYLDLRKLLVIDRAYRCCLSKDYDDDAFARIDNVQQYSDVDLRRDMNLGRFDAELKWFQSPNMEKIVSAGKI